MRSKRNGVIDKEWSTYIHRKHKERLSSVKAIVDDSPPLLRSHLFNKQKKNQLTEGKGRRDLKIG